MKLKIKSKRKNEDIGSMEWIRFGWFLNIRKKQKLYKIQTWVFFKSRLENLL